MANKGVPTVVNCQGAQSIPTQYAAGSVETTAQDMAIEWISKCRLL
jgi:hypothetical protein